MSDDTARAEDPGVILGGFDVIRSAAAVRKHDDDEQELTWSISPALTDWCDLGAIGDLVVRTAGMFSGVQIICYLSVPGRESEPALGEDDIELANRIIAENADVLTHPMYDYAALAMRTQIAGYINPHRVPWATPGHRVVLFDSNEEVTTLTQIPPSE